MSAYCTAADLYLAFGRANVKKWADVDNDEDATSIAARITWAITNASAVMDDRLRKSPAQFPLTDTPYPASVVLNCAYLAGSLLYDSRGVTDFDGDGKPINQVSWARKACEKFIVDVFARLVVLDVVPAIETSESPFYIDAFPNAEDEPVEPEYGWGGWESP